MHGRLLWALLAAQGVAGDPVPPDASQAVGEFYADYARARFTGLPDESHLARIEQRLSAGLSGLLRAARARQAACIQARPDDKPPWADGDLFTSNFESFTRVRLPLEGDLAGTARWILEVAFEYAGDRGPSFSWHDRVVVVRQQGRWVVDDVFYRTAGKGRFTSGFGSGLRRSLASDPGCGR